MNNPFQPVAGGINTAVAPATSGFLVRESTPEVNPKPAMKTDAERKARLAASKEFSDPQAKKSWWKFWASAKKEGAEEPKPDGVKPIDVNPIKHLEKVEEQSKSSDLNRVLERKMTEKEKVENRHNELLNSGDHICKTLEESQSRPIEFKGADILPPIPVENIDALTKSTEQVTGVLQQVNGQLERASQRDDLMTKSILKVDTTLGSLQRVNEKSIAAMGGVEKVLGGVSTAMTEMKQEIKESSRRYKALCEQINEVEVEHSKTVTKLQQRTLIAFSAIGVGLIGSLIAIAVSS
ncbi:hypothetical protein N9938_00310 [Akkermansiaceae bacterium]|nr:hypothetical protein [Akkermansiaceae bacterium]MDA7933242.1 hypothetical protein [bacterium]MDB4287519.1 hypothetical protein [bacterium]MDB4301428.1 hypothetical protein [Akkermansiaceae bacterium]MDB4310046.1 hypothetical protein [Akkermansiaceae bacterium]